MQRILAILILFLPLLLQSQHESILISDGKGICEPSIKIDPNNTDRVVAGMVLNYVARSEDSGKTWNVDRLTSPYGVWGDPVIDVDTSGAFYYFHLSNPEEGDWIDRIVCQRSDDGANTWNDGSFTGLNGTKDQDKHWSVVDTRTNEIFITWTEFDKYGSKDSTCMSRIQFSMSSDQGESWSEARTISQVSGNCLDDDRTVEGAVPAIGPEGELYVSWAGANGIVFRSSFDKGLTWTDEVIVDHMPGGWTFDIPGIYRSNGLPITKCDLSGGLYHGRIYINWCDQRYGEEDTDVFLSYSDDKGRTWSDAIRVNQDSGKTHQFFTWMDVDQATGEVYFVYYDRSTVSEGSWSTNVMMALSYDGAETFVDFPLEKPDKAFVPDPKVFFGDYNNLSVHNGVVRPIWTRMVNGRSSVWTSIVDTEELKEGVYRIRPEFRADKKGEYCLDVFLDGEKKGTLFKCHCDAGKEDFTYIWDANSYPTGVYEFKMMRKNKTLWSKEIQWDGRTQ